MDWHVLLYGVDTHWVSGTPPASSFCVNLINILLMKPRHAALRCLSILLTSGVWVSFLFSSQCVMVHVTLYLVEPSELFSFFIKLSQCACREWNLLWVRRSVSKENTDYHEIFGLSWQHLMQSPYQINVLPTVCLAHWSNLGPLLFASSTYPVQPWT